MTTQEHVAYNREYRKNNPEKVAAWKRNYRTANREKVRQQMQRWHESNPGYKDAYNKDYYRNNKEKVLKTNAEWQERERQTNPLFRLRQALSYRVHRALKSRRRPKTMKLTGCTIEFLKGWLESRWQPEMSWENYGKHGWHVDHIIPCSAFDFSNSVEVKQCFHYTNLQPLWAKDNLRKANFVEETVRNCNTKNPGNGELQATREPNLHSAAINAEK